MKIYNEAIKKKNNLEKIYKYLNIFFIGVLKEFKEKSETYFNKLEELNFIKNSFEEIENRFKLNSYFYNGDKKSNKPELIIYIAEKTKFSTILFKKNDQKILSLKNKKNLYIGIGNYAINFLTKNNFSVVQNFEEFKDEDISNLKAILFNLYSNKIVSKIKFIFQSSNLKNGELTVFPIKDFYVKNNKETSKNLTQKDFKTISFYPDALTFIENATWIYTNVLIENAYIESNFYLIKQKILYFKKVLTELENKIKKLDIVIKKIKQENLNEDILITLQK